MRREGPCSPQPLPRVIQAMEVHLSLLLVFGELFDTGGEEEGRPELVVNESGPRHQRVRTVATARGLLQHPCRWRGMEVDFDRTPAYYDSQSPLRKANQDVRIPLLQFRVSVITDVWHCRELASTPSASVSYSRRATPSLATLRWCTHPKSASTVPAVAHLSARQQLSSCTSLAAPAVQGAPEEGTQSQEVPLLTARAL